ncbi:MAG: autotransporter domain-containing protein [Alphaproteobacteria bacterium]|nr:autotransporter domain-containing protein [Alphaproteobacteria bacterium]
MKKYLTSLISILVSFNTWALSYTGTDNKITEFNDDIIYVNSGAVVEPLGGSISVNYPAVEIHNSGTIIGPIDANDNSFFIYNTGTMSGNIITNHGEIVTQIINSSDDRTNFTINPANFRIEVETGSADINLDNIRSVDAGKIVIKDSRIVMNNFADWQNWDKDVDIEGVVYLIINDAETIQDGDFLAHAVSGDTVNVEVLGADGLHKANLDWIGGRWVITNIRETNYVKIDSALETLRVERSGDKLLSALDSANSWAEIKRIKNLSYQFNHSILLRPVMVINNFTLLDTIKNETDTGAGVSSSYVLSDSVKNFGGRIYIGKRYENLYFNAGFSLNSFSYKDDLNDFSGLMYGLDIKSKQLVDKLWFSEVLGATLTKFRADYITDKSELKSNPLGFSLFGAIDSGYDFNVYKNIVVSPIVGLVWQTAKVADTAETDCYLRTGGNATYAFVTEGIKYEYSLESSIGSNGNFSAGMKIGFWSVMDEAGISLDANVFKDEFDWRYKFGLTGKILF